MTSGIRIVSDLHLGAHTPALNMLFMRALAAWAGKIDALYILGDLFDVWVGDDDFHHATEEVIEAMRAFAAHTPLYVMHGNRDFLLGEDFCRRSGATLIDEPYLLHAYGGEYVLMHGDSLCTLDVAYQQFRAQARQPMWQQMVLAKPLAERKMLAGQIRQMSEIRKENGFDPVTDATQEAVLRIFQAHPRATLIHGHTHRPHEHVYTMDGQMRKRWVLTDWEDASGGGIALQSDGRIEAFRLPEALSD